MAKDWKERRKGRKLPGQATSKAGLINRFRRFFEQAGEDGLMRKVKKSNTFTYSPSDALSLGGVIRRLTVEDKAEMELNVYSSITASLSQTETLYANVETYFAAYGLEHFNGGETPDGHTNMPWPNASDITLPTVFTEITQLQANLIQAVFVPRLVVVTGNTKEAAQNAWLVENFLNAEMRRPRSDGKSWHQHLMGAPLLGLIQGVAPYDIRVEETEVKEPITVPKISDLSLDEESVETEVTVNTKKMREILVKPRYLRDLVLVPPTARNVGECVALGYSELFYEQQLLKMVSAGTLDADAVEHVLMMYPNGSGSIEADRQGNWDKTSNSQVSPGENQGTVQGRMFRNRGPFKVWVYLSNQFDIDGDGATEWNWVYLFDDSPTYLGYEPFRYIVGRPPSAFFAPIPNPDRIIGHSAATHLMDLTGEVSSIVNDINNYLAQIINPTGLQDVDSIIEEEGEYTAYPGRVNLVKPPAGKSVNDVFSWFKPPPLPQEVMAFVAFLQGEIAKVTGINASLPGAAGKGGNTAKAAAMKAQATSMRVNLMALQYRFFLREVINYAYKLYLQYPPLDKASYTFAHDGQTLILDPKILALDYTIDISGISDPSDVNTRRQELIMLAGVVMKFPEVSGSAVHRRNFLKKIFEAWQWADIDDMVGTDEEAKQLQAQEQQQQQMQALTGQKPPAQPGG